MRQIIYGINPVIEALKAPETKLEKILIARGRKGNLETILQLAAEGKVRVCYRHRDDLTALSKGKPHQGVLAVLKAYEYATLERILAAWKQSGLRALLLVLDSIQDPQNLGALIRTANVFGAHGVIIAKDRAVGITAAAVKASAGATALTPVVRVTNIAQSLDRLKEEGIWIVGTTGDTGTPLFEQDLSSDLAVVIGSEGRGIRPRVLNTCDLVVSIPMAGKISSFNASVAAGIVLYEIVRQRTMKTPIV